MVGYTGLTENPAKILERPKTLKGQIHERLYS